jgi:hypothetical protein
MLVLRFMSVNEVIWLLRGDELTNNTNHKKKGNNTNSIGFCFALPDESLESSQAMFEAAQRLSGVATLDICLLATLDNPNTKYWKKRRGHYRWGYMAELSTRRYSLKDFTEWTLYAPNDRYLIMPLASPNYADPRYVTNKEGWALK